jgi:hypothetical protein
MHLLACRRLALQLCKGGNPQASVKLRQKPKISLPVRPPTQPRSLEEGFSGSPLQRPCTNPAPHHVISKLNPKQHNAKAKYEMILLCFCCAVLCRTVPLVKAYVTPPVLLTAFPKRSLLLAATIPRTIFFGALRRPALLIRAAFGLPCCFCESRADQQTGMQHIVSPHWSGRRTPTLACFYQNAPACRFSTEAPTTMLCAAPASCNDMSSPTASS